MKLTDSNGIRLVKHVDYTESAPGIFKVIRKSLDGEILTGFIEAAAESFSNFLFE